MIVLVLPDTTGDPDLLARAQRGNKAAIGQIYDRYVAAIYQFARLRVGNTQDAEDITSMVFEKFIKALAQGKGPHHHLRGWLFQVARNAIYDTYGVQQPLPLETIELWTGTNTAGPEQSVLQSLNGEALRKLIGALSPDQQEVLLLRFDQQLSLQETAEVMGKHINTVKTLQYRAIQHLREMFQRAGSRAPL